MESIERAIGDFKDFEVRRARSRGTPGCAFVEVTVETTSEMDLKRATAIARSMEAAILDRVAEAHDVTVVVSAGHAPPPTETGGSPRPPKT